MFLSNLSQLSFEFFVCWFQCICLKVYKELKVKCFRSPLNMYILYEISQRFSLYILIVFARESNMYEIIAKKEKKRKNDDYMQIIRCMHWKYVKEQSFVAKILFKSISIIIKWIWWNQSIHSNSMVSNIFLIDIYYKIAMTINVSSCTPNMPIQNTPPLMLVLTLIFRIEKKKNTSEQDF